MTLITRIIVGEKCNRLHLESGWIKYLKNSTQRPEAERKEMSIKTESKKNTLKVSQYNTRVKI